MSLGKKQNKKTVDSIRTAGLDWKARQGQEGINAHRIFVQINWQDSSGTYPAVPVVGDDKMVKCAGSQMTTWLSGELRRITDRENVQSLQGRGDVVV